MWINDPLCVPRSKRKYKDTNLKKTLIRRGMLKDGSRKYNKGSDYEKNFEKVNREREVNSIKFSLTLHQEVEEMTQKSYSIPQMIRALNRANIKTSRGVEWYPEGFRRILKRFYLTKKAVELKDAIKRYEAVGMSMETIAHELNVQGILDSRGMPWDETRVKVLIERIGILEEIGGDK